MVRASNRYLEGHGYDSHWGLGKFFFWVFRLENASSLFTQSILLLDRPYFSHSEQYLEGHGYDSHWGLRKFFFWVCQLEKASSLFTLYPSHQSIYHLFTFIISTRCALQYRRTHVTHIRTYNLVYDIAHHESPIAQWLERPTGIWKVIGSTLVGGSENSFSEYFVLRTLLHYLHKVYYCSIALTFHIVNSTSCVIQSPDQHLDRVIQDFNAAFIPTIEQESSTFTIGTSLILPDLCVMIKVTVHLQGWLECKRRSASGLNCRYLNLYINLEL